MHEHDKIAQRLGMLLTRLYSGEKLHLSDLATEYNVTVRTLQRDFNQRLSYLPIEHRSQQYWLDPGFLNHKSDGKLRKLAEQLGITDLFPAPVNIVWVSCWTEAIQASSPSRGSMVNQPTHSFTRYRY